MHKPTTSLKLKKEIKIAGAGPSGLTAAIILAKNGYDVTVYEQRSKIGDRFNDDFQGLENWSRDEDVLNEIKSSGVEIDWWCKPFSKGVLYDPNFRPITVNSKRPLFYLVRRGNKHPKSLDLALYEQAKNNGVGFIFNKRVDPASVNIMAGGPTGSPKAVAAGITFKTDREDLACVILNENLAPSGYVYFLIAGGQATLATVLFKDFSSVKDYLNASKKSVGDLFGVQMFPEEHAWGGYGSFGIPSSGYTSGALLVGEAAGFQDFLFGFGIRNAMISAKLAAASIIEDRDYDTLWKHRLLPNLKASVVNRVVYHKLGNTAKSALWRFAGGSDKPEQFMKWLYNFSVVHRAIYPFVK